MSDQVHSLLTEARRLEDEARRLLLPPGAKRELDGQAQLQRALDKSRAGTKKAAEATTLIRQMNHLHWEVVGLMEGAVHRWTRRWAGLSDDLLQTSRLGVYSAAKRFDPKRGVPFYSYAAWWVRASIMNTNWADSSTPVPRGTAERLQTLSKWEREGIEDPHELADRMGTTVDRIQELRRARTHNRSVSVDAIEGFEPSSSGIDEGEFSDRRLVKETIFPLIETLPPREARVLRMRYRDNGMTYKQISKAIGTSSERARQIELRAIRRLRESLGIQSGGT